MTAKQSAVIKDLLENTGKPVSRAMLDAGYPPATAKNPQQLTESKAWQEVMEEYFPDPDIAAVHKESLGATRIHGTNDNFIEIPDHAVRLKAVELAYKVKGRLKDGLNVAGDVTMNVVVIRHAND